MSSTELTLLSAGSPGSMIGGRYRIESTVASGGMGVLHKAWDLVLERYVAIKLIRQDKARAELELYQTWLRKEALALAKVADPNVLAIHDASYDPPYLVVELLDGFTLEQLLKSKSLTVEEVAQICLQACRGLHAIHEAKQVHKDVKPANIFITKAGIKVIDLGLAHSLDSTDTEMLGVVAMSERYASPEQRSSFDIDYRSDVYSLGLVGWEMLTGRCPDHGEFDNLPSCGSNGFEAVLLKAMLKDRESRFVSALEMAKAIVALGFRSSPYECSLPSAVSNTSPSADELKSLVYEVCDVHVQVLTDDLLSHRANEERLAQFYEGGALRWDIIVAEGDVRRKQGEAFLERLRNPPEGMCIECVVANPGAGKTTFAWRALADLFKESRAHVLQIKGEASAFWCGVDRLCERVNGRLYVLIDDLFSDLDMMRTLKDDVEPHVPVTVVGTSLPNAYRDAGFPYCVNRFDLNAPDGDERDRILEKLGKTRETLSKDELLRFDGASEFMDLMVELTGGAEFREVVRRNLQKLKKQDRHVYETYEYLCFCGQYGVYMPESLVARMDADGRLSRLPDKPSARGFIEWHTDTLLSPRHRKWAALAAAVYSEERDPNALLKKLWRFGDPECAQSRRFIAVLLAALEADQRNSAEQVQTNRLCIDMYVNLAFAELCSRAESLVEMLAWRKLSRAKEDMELVERCEQQMLALAPRNAFECLLLKGLFQRHGKGMNAYELIRQWVTVHPEDGHIRTVLLGAVEQYAPCAIPSLLDETGAWLATDANRHNWHVRIAYLALRERQRDGHIEINKMIEEVHVWLADHPDDAHVRNWFLGLLQRQGTHDERDEAIRTTDAWLDGHERADQVRIHYLSMVGMYGDASSIACALTKNAGWLYEHPDNAPVRAAWLALVRAGDYRDYQECAANAVKQWLTQHRDALEVWEVFFALLFDLGRCEEAACLAQEIAKDNPDNTNIILHYLRGISLTSKNEQVEQEHARVVREHPRLHEAKSSYAKCLMEQNRLEEAARLLKEILDENPKDGWAAYHYGNCALQRGLHMLAEDTFASLCTMMPALGYVGLAKVSAKKRDYHKALRHFGKALNCARDSDVLKAVVYTARGKFKIDGEMYGEALDDCYRAMILQPQYYGNYIGIAYCYMGMRSYEPALGMFGTALKIRPHLCGKTRQDLDHMMERCKIALKSPRLPKKSGHHRKTQKK